MAIVNKLLKALLKESKPKPRIAQQSAKDAKPSVDKGKQASLKRKLKNKRKVLEKFKPKKRQANTEDFYGVEFDLKARGKTPAQREKIAKEMGFDDEGAKSVRQRKVKARGKLPKSSDPGIAKNRSSGPKVDSRNMAGLKAAAEKPKTPKSKGSSRKYNMDAKQFEPNKPQAAGMVKRESPLKSKAAKLAEEYDGMTADVKRGHRMKGKDSKYYSVFKARNMKKMKDGGKVYKRKHGGKVVSGNDGNSIVAGCYV